MHRERESDEVAGNRSLRVAKITSFYDPGKISRHFLHKLVKYRSTYLPLPNFNVYELIGWKPTIQRRISLSVRSLCKREKIKKPENTPIQHSKKKKMDRTSFGLSPYGMYILLATFVGFPTGCDNRTDLPESPSSHPTIPVSLTVGLSQANDEEISPAARNRYAMADVIPEAASVTQRHETATAGAAFDFRLLPAALTRTASESPQSLYNLEIRQYDATTGTCMNPAQPVMAQQAIGAAFTANLAVTDACRLVLVAWGKSVVNRLGTGTLADAQEVAVSQDDIAGLDPGANDDRDKMPYCLYLPDVKVTADGKIQSPGGTDVRLLLRRLAVRVSFDWTYQVPNYALKTIRLESVPKDYRLLPSPDKAGTYPSLLDQYTTLSVPESAVTAPSGHYAFWIPASVRGTAAAATSAVYRTKANAPTGSVYATFIAQHAVDEKQKLNYRLYLGGNTSSDFNLYANKDYLYTVGFTHTDLPVNDQRVTIINPIPASENNNNFVPTANCLMVAPGGAFNFNPYTFSVEGTETANTLLQSWCASAKIKSVKVFWQTKENGDVGDAVLGTVNSPADHTNIVELKNGDDFTAARIYCRVASGTAGGSGLIAAYDDASGTGNILWSWHIWVTDYNPEPTGNATVLVPASKRKQKYQGNSAPDQWPMMDRNLGAMAGYDTPPALPLDQSKANGFHYQQGRKDPFPSSYSAEAKSQINNIYSATPPKGMLNLYAPDGITYKPRERNAMSSIQEAYRNPICMYTSTSFSTSQGSAWGGSVKTVHDPCPAGWRVAAKENYRALFSGTYLNSGNTAKYTPRLASGFSWNDGEQYGGYPVVFDDEAHTTYFRMTGFGNNTNSFVIVGQAGNVWTRDYSYTFDFGFNVNASGRPAYEVSRGWLSSDAHTTRCIQERE